MKFTFSSTSTIQEKLLAFLIVLLFTPFVTASIQFLIFTFLSVSLEKDETLVLMVINYFINLMVYLITYVKVQ